MRMYPVIIGAVTFMLFSACRQQIPPVDFRQQEMSSSASATGDLMDAPNEATPKTVDSLEVGGVLPPINVRREGHSIIMGSDDAPHTLTIYDDYGCEYCQEFGIADLPWLLKTYVAEKTLKIERVFVPKSPAGKLMAMVALCSEKQKLFSETDAKLHVRPITSEKQIPALATLLKLNLKSLNTCMSTSAVSTDIQGSIDAATNAGITRLPAFTLGTNHWIGVLSREELMKMVNGTVSQ